jgi:hypothetical protein
MTLLNCLRKRENWYPYLQRIQTVLKSLLVAQIVTEEIVRHLLDPLSKQLVWGGRPKDLDI